jgi:hypothetical protein
MPCQVGGLEQQTALRPPVPATWAAWCVVGVHAVKEDHAQARGLELACRAKSGSLDAPRAKSDMGTARRGYKVGSSHESNGSSHICSCCVLLLNLYGTCSRSVLNMPIWLGDGGEGEPIWLW